MARNALARVACVGVMAAGMFGLAALPANAQTGAQSLKADVVTVDGKHIGYYSHYTCVAVGEVGVRMGQWRRYSCTYAGYDGWRLVVWY